MPVFLLQNDAVLRDNQFKGPGEIGLLRIESHVSLHELTTPGSGEKPWSHPEGGFGQLMQGLAEMFPSQSSRLLHRLAIDETIDVRQEYSAQAVQGRPLDKIGAFIVGLERQGLGFPDVERPVGAGFLLGAILGKVDIPELIPEFKQAGATAVNNGQMTGGTPASHGGTYAQIGQFFGVEENFRGKRIMAAEHTVCAAHKRFQALADKRGISPTALQVLPFGRNALILQFFVQMAAKDLPIHSLVAIDHQGA